MTQRGERRFITLMDVDLVGSTSMDVAVGQEAAADVKLAFRRIAREEIERHFGSYRSNGDGLFAEFGFSQSVERSTLAAVRAARAIIRRIEDPTGPMADLPVQPQARFGIHTGLTLILPDERGILDYFGTTPDLAARLQAIASPNQICLSEDAYAAVRDLYEAHQHPLLIRGFADPVQVFVIEREREAPLHGESGHLGRFLGREQELAELARAWAVAHTRTQTLAVYVTGPGGIGKTRLVHEFCSSNAVTPLILHCDPFAQGESLAAVSDALNRSGAEVLPPGAAIEHAQAALLRVLDEHARGSAARVLVVDDIQFADPSTLQLLDRLSADEHAPMLIITTSRELPPAIGPNGPADVTHLPLGPLRSDDAHGVLLSLGGRDLSPAERAGILSVAGGVPLYLRELVFTRGNSHQPEWRQRSAIPPSLWPAFEARLNPEGADISALQRLSLFEGPLPVPVALAVTDLEEESALIPFQRAGMLRLDTTQSETSCAFQHELVRTAVYERITVRERSRMHQQCARSLLERCGSYAEQHPHVVGRQFELAGDSHSAARSYRMAGDRAERQGAYLVAEAHYAHAFNLAESDALLCASIGERLVRVQMVNHGFGDTATVGATLARMGALNV